MAASPTDVSPSPDGAPQPASAPILVRVVRQQDLYGLAELLARGFHTQEGVMGWLYPLLRLGIYEDLRNRIHSNSTRQVFLVAALHSSLVVEQRLQSTPLSIAQLVGAVEIVQRTPAFWQPQRFQQLYLSNLVVQAEYRRKGVASQLLAACEQVAIEWKISDLYLHVLENNDAAQQLYFGAGYQLERIDTGIGTWLLGQPRQLFLHKRLSTCCS
jgi:ribosomal protein S18 acetylase RimI-like enzyme